MGSDGTGLRGVVARVARLGGAAVVVCTLWAAALAEAAPGAIPYRGELTYADGTPFDGTVEVKAALYASETGGTAVWGPATWPSVSVNGGTLEVVLGDAPSPALDGSELPPDGLWLELWVDGVKLEPRQRVLSTAYSLRSGDAERLGGEEASAYATHESVEAAGYLRSSDVSSVALTGAYGDLSGTPSLSVYAQKSELAAVATSGAYADLTGAPSLGAYALVSEVAPVCWSGSYADLANTPDLSVFVLVTDLHPIAQSGAWSDLEGAPDAAAFLRADGTTPLGGPWDAGGQPVSNLVVGSSASPPSGVAGQLWWDGAAGVLKIHDGSSWLPVSGEAGGGGVATALQCSGCVDEVALSFALSAVAKSGSYGDLSGAPALAAVATSGQYADLSGAPSLDAYAMKSSLSAVATSGKYGDLSGAPSLADYAKKAELSAVASTGAYTDLSGTPNLGGYALISDVAPVCWSGSYAELSNTPDLSSFVHLADLHPIAQSGSYADLAGKPDLGAYLRADGTVKPVAPLDLSQQPLLNVVVHNAAVAPGSPKPGQLWYDTTSSSLRVWTGLSWVATGGAAVLPVDGLDQVSNGVLTTKFESSAWSSGVPAEVKDYWPAGTSVSLTVNDPGALLWLKVHVKVTHPSATDLRVVLTPPSGGPIVLHDRTAGQAGGLDGEWPPLVPASGDLTSLLGTDPSGVWSVHVEDQVFSGGVGGTIAKLGVSYGILRGTQVAVKGDQIVEGALTVGGVDVGAELASLKAEVWCLKECDEAKKGDCRKYACDGASQACLDAGGQPDGAACWGGAGVCFGSACCVPGTCATLGAGCGLVADGCGGVIACGECVAGQVCHQSQCCAPATCDGLGKECGTWGDGCGGVVECGGCTGDYACGPSGACDAWLGTCGGVSCPSLSGYTATCNPQSHCEYVRSAPTAPWHTWDVWIYVPPGSFPMGCPGGSETCGGSSEQPVHTVTFATGYLIAKHEIVVTQYEACQSAGTCSAASTADWDGNGWGTNTSANGRSSHPQNGLTWQQSKDFCGWVASGGRLPSEAEWEYAATGTTHRKYPWGNAPEPTCSNGTAVFNELGTTAGYGCGTGGTWSAGSKTAGASARGALDMAGNLWEWVEDCWHDSYTGAPTNGSAWTDSCSGSYRVGRGGGFSDSASNLRVARRSDVTPGYRYANRGARCLRPFP
ncbi:MAG: hypothetical protein AMXMBFR64_33960 [Myxococcales bacterium]